MTATAIALHQINKTYANGTTALQGVDLNIYTGELVSLVGPSGCGKSTVLKLVAGLDQPTHGHIAWQTRERHLAFVFQDAALMPWATVVDNVHLPLKLKGQSLRASRSRIQAALNLVALQGFEHSYPRQLSGGMKMRVSIARALVTQPQILLMDEPFGALDEISRSRLNGELLQLWQQHHWTVVFVTHNIYEAVYLSHRVVVMGAQPGRIVATVAVDEPYPRSESFRTTPQFNRYCREVAHHLAIGDAPTPDSMPSPSPSLSP
ncbi:MAG: ABC transporter ATP-binding protein [Leptolyngbyaceae cyanobacterium]